MNEYFDDIEMAGRTGKSKADNIRLIIERNELKHAIYVGDTDGDCNSSKLAGVPFVFAVYGFGNVDNPEYVINSFEDIIEVANKVFV